MTKLLETIEAHLKKESKCSYAWISQFHVRDMIRRVPPEIAAEHFTLRGNVALATAAILVILHNVKLKEVKDIVSISMGLGGVEVQATNGTPSAIAGLIIESGLMNDVVIMATQILRSVRELPDDSFNPDFRECAASSKCVWCSLRVNALDLADDDVKTLENVRVLPGVE